MPTFHLDLHCHSFFSADGVSDPVELIAAARRKGLHGFAMTDHNTCEAVAYLEGKGLLRADGRPVDGFLVIPGVEVTTAEGHLLCLGATLPDLKGHPAAEVVAAIHAAGGLAIPPHPYDIFRAGIRRVTLDTLPIDGVEVFNAATTLHRYNRKAFDYAQERKLQMTGVAPERIAAALSGHAHHEAAIGTAFSLIETDDFSVRGVLEGIRRGAQLNQTYLRPKDSFRKTWNNWMRLRPKRKLPKVGA